jgi:hypothetical protein
MEKEMRELYIEGVAIHGGPEPCVGVREGAGEASVGVRVGWAIEPSYTRMLWTGVKKKAAYLPG